MADGEARDVLGRDVERALELGIGGDHVRAQQPGQVEGLGRRGELEAMLSVPLPQRAVHRHRVPRIGEVGVDLIGEHRHAVVDADVAESPELVGAPHASDRIVGVAQHDGRAARVGGFGGQIVEIHGVMAGLVHDQLVVEDGEPVVLGRRSERVVDGSLDDDLVSGMGHRAQGRVDGRHDAVGQAHPFRPDPPVVAAVHPADQRVEIRVGRIIVAEDVGLRGMDERVDDLGGRLELHVGHGHGDHVVVPGAHVLLDHVPLHGSGVPPVHQGLKIVHAEHSFR